MKNKEEQGEEKQKEKEEEEKIPTTLDAYFVKKNASYK